MSLRPREVPLLAMGVRMPPVLAIPPTSPTEFISSLASPSEQEVGGVVVTCRRMRGLTEATPLVILWPKPTNTPPCSTLTSPELTLAVLTLAGWVVSGGDAVVDLRPPVLARLCLRREPPVTAVAVTGGVGAVELDAAVAKRFVPCCPRCPRCPCCACCGARDRRFAAAVLPAAGGAPKTFAASR